MDYSMLHTGINWGSPKVKQLEWEVGRDICGHGSIILEDRISECGNYYIEEYFGDNGYDIFPMYRYFKIITDCRHYWETIGNTLDLERAKQLVQEYHNNYVLSMLEVN